MDALVISLPLDIPSPAFSPLVSLSLSLSLGEAYPEVGEPGGIRGSRGAGRHPLA